MVVFDSERIPLTLAFAGWTIGLMDFLVDTGTDWVETWIITLKPGCVHPIGRPFFKKTLNTLEIFVNDAKSY